MDHLAVSRLSTACTSPVLPNATEAMSGRLGAMTGRWKLDSGRAVTVRAGQSGTLRIAHGRVWATFEKAGDDIDRRGGDHFLSRGDSLAVRAGDALVLEPYGHGHLPAAYYSWEPAAANSAVRAQAGDVPGVLQSLRDLRVALGLVATALGRLARGLVGGTRAGVEGAATGAAMVFVAERGRGALPACALTAQASDKRAQCSIS